MPPFVQPTMRELVTVADATVATLENLGYKCCFFGGFACRLYGSDRLPEDIDVVVLDASANQEAIKRQLAAKDPRFYLVEPKTYGATYKVLWFRLSQMRSCKVDVLLPGILNIPNVGYENVVQLSIQLKLRGTTPRFVYDTSPSTTTTINRTYPLMPLSVVLLLKLQGWADHRVALMTYMRRKVHSDIRDINKLVVAAKAAGVKPAEENFVPKDFLEEAKKRVRAYVVQQAQTASSWRELGLFEGDVKPPSEEAARLEELFNRVFKDANF
ncbi:hypothetical protein SCHPADRAFT_819913 [Schizopora paradoxa]|uniref:Nucleotidyltransferase n=1 Tax=Schizopora paradoxa TaxID=27342 RepID=A0A0H2S9I2_9AGAM|nr:hypothetical protein SCHPADRAFT_819913 [Schizopora paradoxa]